MVLGLKPQQLSLQAGLLSDVWRHWQAAPSVLVTLDLWVWVDRWPRGGRAMGFEGCLRKQAWEAAVMENG